MLYDLLTMGRRAQRPYDLEYRLWLHVLTLAARTCQVRDSYIVRNGDVLGDESQSLWLEGAKEEAQVCW